MKIVFCSITIYLRIVRFKGFVTFVFFFNRWNFLFKVIILYNSNDRETKRLNKKQLKEVENAKNLEEIKENSSERKKFKRVSLGFLIRNSYTSISVKSTNLEPLFQNCNTFIRINVDKFPPRIFCYCVGIIRHLRFVTFNLIFAVRTDSTIGGDA